MSLLPLKTAISDTYPLPSNATARAGFASLWDSINEFQQKSELDLASAATLDIGAQLSTKLRITGATGITSLGTNYRGPIYLRFSGAVTLTHNATTLRLPGATNLTTAAGDVLMAWPTATVSGTLDGWQVVRLATAGGDVASTANRGLVELATDAEAQAGTDTTRAVTSDNLGATVIGIGQSWQSMSASRAASTVYTNSTGRPIQVNVSLVTSASCTITYIVSGISSYGSSSPAAGSHNYASFIVPNGGTYSCTNNAGTSAISGWIELR